MCNLGYLATWWTDLHIQSVAWYPVVFHPQHFMFPFHHHSCNTVAVPAKHNQQDANNTIFGSPSQHCGCTCITQPTRRKQYNLWITFTTLWLAGGGVPNIGFLSHLLVNTGFRITRCRISQLLLHYDVLPHSNPNLAFRKRALLLREHSCVE